jgi:hypothetical protein
MFIGKRTDLTPLNDTRYNIGKRGMEYTHNIWRELAFAQLFVAMLHLMMVVTFFVSLTGRQRRPLSTPRLTRMSATALPFADLDPVIS